MKKFDLTTVYHEKRPLSWSAIYSFEWNPKQWHDKYVLGIQSPMTPELTFGSAVDKRIQDEPDFLPDLVRYDIFQHEMRATYKGIPLLGFADTVDMDTFRLRDYKTGRKPWDQKRADETGQLTMYVAMMYLANKSIKPEFWELFIDWLPTHYEDKEIQFIEEGDIRSFRTKRSMRQVLAFLQRIEDTWAAMEAYASRDHGAPHVKVKNPVSRMLK